MQPYTKKKRTGAQNGSTSMESGAEFLENYDASTGRCWIFERNGVPRLYRPWTLQDDSVPAVCSSASSRIRKKSAQFLLTPFDILWIIRYAP
ncbi:Acyl-CoA N-acyltransferase [Penicillium psychrosexuale]|uniref:Acyl-CoA N-acyltransferase n=1 Tax=Penicillium psychrosexuale TaxID=1002107 RepID=UPI002545306B|nr:Acyl-CoA N-acyltransferase [Penicillium psychrosexuale]KAJ5791836.1 Acyl-CoA N-acyltransferase [Penicillium psychrosexuale]